MGFLKIVVGVALNCAPRPSSGLFA